LDWIVNKLGIENVFDEGDLKLISQREMVQDKDHSIISNGMQRKG